MRAYFIKKEFKPFISLFLVLLSFLIVAFVKITLRQMSYSLYQKNKIFYKLQDKYFSNIKSYYNKTESSKLENLAKKHDFEKRKKGQILQVVNGQAVVIY